ncbi:DsbA family protein [Mycobacterium sp.]|uniref:DsbA family protein n=1 Tax=Mycobacterium sp. TaxID=1785 RepID=UPI00127CBEAC|nr:DsbA family protein [Mycobacterium sp.]KAA8967758.1 MAG: DsbA family protein [Mycobacterium sp.]
MASKPKRPAYDLSGRHRDLAVRIGLTAIVVVFAVVLVGYIVLAHHSKGEVHGQAIRVTSGKLITKDGKPKAVVAFYEDFLCPACGHFERTYGPTVAKLIDSGAIAADYYMVGLLSSPRNDDYSSRAGAAAYCVADVSIDAFRRFHTALFSKNIQPSETGTVFPDNARLIELAREAGAAGTVPECVNSGKYIPMVDGLASATGIHATPTVRINGQDYQWSSGSGGPEALVAKIKEIVGDVPGLDTAATPPAS